MKEKEKRLLVIDSARKVEHLLNDKRTSEALDIAEQYANGKATDSDLMTARQIAQIAGVKASADWDGEYINEFSDRFFASIMVFAACVEDSNEALSMSYDAIISAIDGLHYGANPTGYVSKFTLLK